MAVPKSTAAAGSSVANEHRSKHLAIPFSKLVEKRQFGAIEDALYRVDNDEALCLWLEEDYIQNNSSGETALHRLAASQPPVTCVDILLHRLQAIYPDTAVLDSTDAQGRTPLHVAVINRSTDIVPLLTYGSSSNSNDVLLKTTIVTAPLIPDAHGRTPLHWACTHARVEDVRSKAKAKPRGMGMRSLLTKIACFDKSVNMVGAVRILLDVYPEAVLMRDGQGYTPLDLAIAHDGDNGTGADPFILKLVHEATLLLNSGHNNSRATTSIEAYRDNEVNSSFFEGYHSLLADDDDHHNNDNLPNFACAMVGKNIQLDHCDLKDEKENSTIKTASVTSGSRSSSKSTKSLPYAIVEL